MGRGAGPGEQVGDHHVKRRGPDLFQDRAGVADPDPDPGRAGPPITGPLGRCPARRLVQGQQPPDQINQGRIGVHGQLPGPGTGRRHVPGQGECPAAEMQDPQRLPGRCGEVGQVPEPPHVLELQVLRVVEVYMGLRDAIHPQGPGPRPVSVGHELGHARRDICLDGLPVLACCRWGISPVSPYLIANRAALPDRPDPGAARPGFVHPASAPTGTVLLGLAGSRTGTGAGVAGGAGRRRVLRGIAGGPGQVRAVLHGMWLLLPRARLLLRRAIPAFGMGPRAATSSVRRPWL